MGHWARVCRNSRSVNEVAETERGQADLLFSWFIV